MAAIAGYVTDGTNASVPGVLVEASSNRLMRPRTTVTGDDGSYRLPALPPGTYRLVFSRDGFEPSDREVSIGVGSQATVNVTLEIAPLSVSVSGSGIVIGGQSATVASHFNADRLAQLPSARTMWSLQELTPGVRLPAVDVGGSAAATPRPTTAYGTTGWNQPTVEGMSIAGINPTGFTLDYGSFAEVAVQTAAHGPEWISPGVHMQVISKSGGDRYHGTLYAGYEYRRWQWVNIDEEQIDRGVTGGGDIPPRAINRLWSYHDINADAGGYVIRDRLWWYGSFRRQQIVSQRVNVPVEPNRTFLTNYTGKATYQITTGHRLIAFAQTGRNRQPFSLDPFAPGSAGIGQAAAIADSVESTAVQGTWAWVGKVEWNAIFTDRTLFEIRAGQFGANRRARPNGAGPRFEDVGSLLVSGASRDWESRFRRSQLGGSVSRFSAGRAGRHHLRAGGEVFRVTETEIWRHGYGDEDEVLHVLRNGQPIEVFLFETPSRAVSGLYLYGVHANDTWEITRRLTLNLGLRFGRYRAFLPAQTHTPGRFTPETLTLPAVGRVIAWNTLAPRVSAAYDVQGDGRTLVKVAYGMYRLPPGLGFGFRVNPNTDVWWRRYRWSDPDGSGVWEPGEESAELGRRGGVVTESLDPTLGLQRLDELGAWVERELLAGTGLRAGVLWRGSRQPFARQNLNQPFEAFTVPVTLLDPGPDGIPGTADDGASIQAYDLRPEFVGLPAVHVLRNVPGAEDRHWTWEISATRRASHRWSLAASYSHTWSREHAASFTGQAVRNNVYPLTPNDLINTDVKGRHTFTSRTAKVSGTFAAPWQVGVTPIVRHQSGEPSGRTFLATPSLRSGAVRVLAEPVGTRRTDHVTVVDLQLEWRIPVRGVRRLTAFVDVFNLLNANPELNLNWSSGEAFLRPLTILPPRILRAGTKLDW